MARSQLKVQERIDHEIASFRQRDRELFQRSAQKTGWWLAGGMLVTTTPLGIWLLAVTYRPLFIAGAFATGLGFCLAIGLLLTLRARHHTFSWLPPTEERRSSPVGIALGVGLVLAIPFLAGVLSPGVILSVTVSLVVGSPLTILPALASRRFA